MPDGIGKVETQRAVVFTDDRPLVLESGARLTHVEVAYETYGELNAERSNAIFICHALSGDAHAAGYHDGDRRPGWWDNIVGPGRPLDSDRFFIVCANVLGGCRGRPGRALPTPRPADHMGCASRCWRCATSSRPTARCSPSWA